jgi:RNA polymerase sigma-70 factor, ECF subfamily
VTRRRTEEPAALFERLFRATRGDLLAYIVRRSRSAEDAADVLAETYLIAWRRLEAIPEGDRARLWLFGVARNLLLKGATQRRSGDALLERLASELRSARIAVGDDERREPLGAALASLPERDREILKLTAWEGLAPREIAAVMGLPANAVRVRLHRARSRLKRDLEASRPESEAALEGAPLPQLFS